MKTITLLLTLLLTTTLMATSPKRIKSDRYTLKALQYAKDKDYEKSVKYFKKVLKLKLKQEADFYFEYGEQGYFLLTRIDPYSKKITIKEIAKAFNKFLTIKKEKDETYMKALDYLNKLDELEELVNVCKNCKDDKCKQKNLCSILERTKECSSKDDSSCFNMGDYLLEHKDLETAFYFYDKADEFDNKEEHYRYLNAGEHLFDKGYHEEAERYFQKASKTAYSCNSIAEYYYENNNYEGAERYFQKACEKSDFYCNSIAEYYDKKSNTEKAEEYHKKACKKDSYYCKKD